jgi:hypothetical protein
MRSEDVEHAAEHLHQLIGFKIVEVMRTEDSSSYGFIVEGPRVRGKIKRKECWVDRDPEGNGPGWLQIENQKNG